MNQDAGRFGEDVAVKHYEACGYRIVQRNYRVHEGEIDLIAIKGDDLVLAEVKLRKTNLFGGALSSLSEKRIQRLKNAALVFLQKNPELASAQPRLVLLAVQGSKLTEITLD